MASAIRDIVPDIVLATLCDSGTDWRHRSHSWPCASQLLELHSTQLQVDQGIYLSCPDGHLDL